MIYTDNKDFYPTPEALFQRLLGGKRFLDGLILEPSAGKGDMFVTFFENEWLRFKMFYNGNIHVWFNDLKLLDKLNYICGQHFAWIPSEGEQKENEEARRWVAKEFGDIGTVKLLRE